MTTFLRIFGFALIVNLIDWLAHHLFSWFAPELQMHMYRWMGILKLDFVMYWSVPLLLIIYYYKLNKRLPDLLRFHPFILIAASILPVLKIFFPAFFFSRIKKALKLNVEVNAGRLNTIINSWIIVWIVLMTSRFGMWISTFFTEWAFENMVLIQKWNMFMAYLNPLFLGLTLFLINSLKERYLGSFPNFGFREEKREAAESQPS